MRKVILVSLCTIILTGCRNQKNESIIKFDGTNYLSYDKQLIMIGSGVHILYEKYDEYNYSHLILVGKSLETDGDYDYLKYASQTDYLRVAYVSNSANIPENICGSYELDINKINIIKRKDTVTNITIIDTVISGNIKIYQDYSISNLTIFKFNGVSNQNKTIASECYIQNYITSYALERHIKGNIKYCDSIINLSNGVFNYVTDSLKEIVLSDYYPNYRVWLSITLRVNKDDVTGTYVYDDSNYCLVKLFIRHYDTNRDDDICIASGKVIIVKNNTNYKIEFNLISEDNKTLIGSWDGDIK
jgi:hypothetical protein